MNIERERAAFEWWASDEGGSPRATERAGGCYKLAQIQSYWMAWQARAALQAELADMERDYLTIIEAQPAEQQPAPDVAALVEALEACDTALFCDLKTDEEKSTFFLSGRGYETGVIAQAIQNDVAMAYHRCSEYRKEMEALQAENALLRAAIRHLCNIYVVDDYYEGQLREESLDAAVNRAINATPQPSEHQPDVTLLLSLLSHARCNTCDGSGGLYDNHGQPHQCQWCHDRSEALAAHRKQQEGQP